MFIDTIPHCTVLAGQVKSAAKACRAVPSMQSTAAMGSLGRCVGKEGSRIVTLSHLGAASNVGVMALFEGLTMDRRSGLVWICKVVAVCEELGSEAEAKASGARRDPHPLYIGDQDDFLLYPRIHSAHSGSPAVLSQVSTSSEQLLRVPGSLDCSAGQAAALKHRL